MCGRFAFLLPQAAWRGQFKVSNDFPALPRYNIVPTQPVVTILEREGRRTAELFRWGFVPGWVKDPREFALLANARAESMLDKPSFRDSVRNTRCVIPASGYYEWMKAPSGGRRPYYITSTETEIMAFAGLYSTWAGPNGEEVDTLCIVTVKPNLEISGGYERMPAVLRGDGVDAWLNTREIEARDAAIYAVTPPLGTMKYHPVGDAISRADADGPELILPIADAPLAERPGRARKVVSGQLDLF